MKPTISVETFAKHKKHDLTTFMIEPFVSKNGVYFMSEFESVYYSTRINLESTPLTCQ